MMTTNIEQDIIDFEAWAVPNRYSIEILKDDVLNTFYTSFATVHAWKAWQAALKLERERQASGEAFGYVMQPAFDENIKRSTICQDKHGSYQIPLFTAPQQAYIPAIDVNKMVDRFLGWKLPADFSPDAGISFTPPFKSEVMNKLHSPIGTNLFNADQAKAMFEYCIEGSAAATQPIESGNKVRQAVNKYPQNCPVSDFHCTYPECGCGR